MVLLAIQDNVLINPEEISVVEMNTDKKGSVTMNVTVEGRTFTVLKPADEFFQALNSYGVDLTKQYFAV